MTAAERLAAFTSTLTMDAIPDEVREAAKLHLLDTLGTGLAAHGLDAVSYTHLTLPTTPYV